MHQGASGAKQDFARRGGIARQLQTESDSDHEIVSIWKTQKCELDIGT